MAIDYIRHLDQLLHATDPKQVDKFKVNFMRRRRSNASLISSSPASSSSSSPVSSSSSSSSPISSSTMNEHDAKEKNAETVSYSSLKDDNHVSVDTASFPLSPPCVTTTTTAKT